MAGSENQLPQMRLGKRSLASKPARLALPEPTSEAAIFTEIGNYLGALACSSRRLASRGLGTPKS